ncbi:MAG: molecular chaperone SurA [Gammaproteobacteria bacterium]|nr:molecular chaperone SurA [Gammaproteobacteria bacterium]
MRRALLLIACALWLAAALTVPCPPAAAQPPAEGRTLLDRVVAVVNDEPILLSELERRLEEARSQLRRQSTAVPSPAVLRKQVLERMVLQRLQLQVAERSGVRVDDTTLNRTIRRIAGQNELSLSEFQRVLERDGYSFEAFREDVREQILLSRLHQRQVEDKVRVTEREVERLLAEQPIGRQNAQYHLSHILIATPEAASPEEVGAARARAGEIVERLRAGADFAETAVAVSDGQQALEGGDLGWRGPAEVPTLFAEFLPDMAAGEVHGPVRSASGFHIVKLLDKRGEERHVVTQTHARHILIQTDVHTDEEAKLRLEQLRTRARGGEDFAGLARSHSADTRTAPKGGDLGWVDPGEVPPEIERAMEALAPGEVSAPIETEAGWHIVQVLERREHDSTEAYRRAQARERIRQRKVEEELDVWLRQLRDEAYVEYRLEDVGEG